MFVTNAIALEAPADDAPPPPVQVEKKTLPHFDLNQPAADTHHKVAFLGVVSGEVPPLLMDHLDLKSGEGVFIRSLEPGSPAAQAGIMINDVVTKVSGQPVSSPRELSTQISGQKPGDLIKIDLIHKGKPITLDVVLGTKPTGAANTSALKPFPMGQIALEGLPEDLANRIRDAIAGNIGGMNLDNDAAQLPPQLGQAIQKLQLQLQGAAGQAHFMPGGAKSDSHASATVKAMDDQGSVEVKTNDDSKEVTICDKNGQVTWSGPWNTTQDKAAAPEEIRKRVEALNLDSTFNGNRLRLNLRKGPLPEDQQD